MKKEIVKLVDDTLNELYKIEPDMDFNSLLNKTRLILLKLANNVLKIKK